MNRIEKILQSVENEKRWPGMYEGYFLEQGIVNYKDVKIGIGLLPKPTIDTMLNSFIGRPVVIYHKDVTADNCNDFAVGYVINSFFEPSTGKYKVQFLITKDEAHDRIKEGFELSCAYTIKQTGGSGTWHALPYDFEIKGGEFTHLALVPNPRYENSTIDPMAFPMLVNSKGEAFLQPTKEESIMKFKWFGKKEEKARNIENTFIDVGGKKVSVKELAAAHVAHLKNQSPAHEDEGELGEESEVEVLNAAGEKIKVKVADLVNSYNIVNKKEVKNCNCGAEGGAKHGKECEMYNSEEETDEEKEKREKKEKEDKDKEKTAENARIEARAEEIANHKIAELRAKAGPEGLKFFNETKKASQTVLENEFVSSVSNSREDQLSRGNEAYGPLVKKEGSK